MNSNSSQLNHHLVPTLEAPFSLHEPSDYRRQSKPTDHQISQELYRRMGKTSSSFLKQMNGECGESLMEKQPSLINHLLGSLRDESTNSNQYNDATSRRGFTSDDTISHPSQYGVPKVRRAQAPDDSFLLTEASCGETHVQERSLNDENEHRSIYDHLAEHREKMDLLYTLREARRMANLTSERDEQQVFDSIDEDQDNDADDLIFEIEL